MCLWSILALSPVMAFSAGVSSTGGQFLKIPAGVRAAAMGETFTAIADDTSTTHWNSAGLSQLDLYEIQFLHVSFFESVNYEFLGAGVPVGPGGALGLSAALNLVPSFNSTGSPSAAPGEASDLAFSAGYGQAFGDNMAFGLGAKYLSSRLMDSRASGFGMDAGTLIYTRDRRWTLGLSVQNVGQVSCFDPYPAKEKLPASYRLGAAFRAGRGRPTNLTLGLEVEKPLDNDPVFHAGAEYWMGFGDLAVAFRGGYKADKLDNELGDLVGASFGTGIRFSSLQFDYALVPFGLLGNTHRFSMTYRFGTKGVKTAMVPETAQTVPEKLVAVDIQPQIADYKSGSIKSTTFDLRPQARTQIKDWELEITDPKGNILRRYTGKGVPPRQIQWDGRNDAGDIVTGGLFANYNLRTVDKAGQQTTASEPIFKIEGVEGRTAILDSVDPSVLAAAGLGPVSRPPLKPDQLKPVGPSGVIRVPSLLFGPRRTGIPAGDDAYLRSVAKVISQYPGSRVYIEGHAYAEGAEAAQLRLSQDRADAVLRYLLEKGKVSPANLYARGHGSSAPVDARDTQEAVRKNRRVDIVILTK